MRNSKLIYLAFVILAIFQVYSIVQIDSLKSRVQETESQIASTKDYIRGTINNIFTNEYRIGDNPTSIVTSCGYEIGELNTQSFQVPITFRLQPKTLSETTRVLLKFSEEKLPMQRQDTEFVLTKDFAIKDEVFPTIIIEDNGVQQFEEHECLRVNKLKDEVFSSLSPCFEGECGYCAQEPYNYNMKGNITTSSSINGDNSFLDIKYIVTLDGEVIKTDAADFVGMGTIGVDDQFELKEGQTLMGIVVAIDELHFTHEYLMMHYVGGKGEQGEPYDRNEKITAPDGTLIYNSSENETCF